jgi:formate--tetrahydrofolate ligase
MWPHAVDMNDRALRRIAIGLGGRENGPARESAYVITAASEIMAIVALSESRADLRVRLGRIVVALSRDGKPVTATDLGAVGAMMVLLNDALLPNLVQTTEGAPAIVHCGPFANIAHGTSSVLAQRMGLRLADYVINETGFGADLGAEKFMDLVMPMCGHVPSAAAMIVTLKALRTQGGAVDGPVEAGFPNLARHLLNMQRWGVPCVVALNRYASDSESDLQKVLDYCRSIGADAAIADGYMQGGDGMTALAAKLVSAAASTDLSRVAPLYTPEQSLEAKLRTIATQVYGASDVVLVPAARRRLAQFEALGYGKLPLCIAKTQYSFSDDPNQMGAPSGFTLTVSDVTLSAGAGFVVAIAGKIMLMPGLGKAPAAHKLDVDGEGRVTGMDY